MEIIIAVLVGFILGRGVTNVVDSIEEYFRKKYKTFNDKDERA